LIDLTLAEIGNSISISSFEFRVILSKVVVDGIPVSLVLVTCTCGSDNNFKVAGTLFMYNLGYMSTLALELISIDSLEYKNAQRKL
jgi:hypothetical protein